MGESVASIDAVTDLVFKVPVLLAGAPPGCVNIFIGMSRIEIVLSQRLFAPPEYPSACAADSPAACCAPPGSPAMELRCQVYL